MSFWGQFNWGDAGWGLGRRMFVSCYTNILETSAVTLSLGTVDTACPLYRLYDRNIGRPFKSLSAEPIEIKVAQGAAILPADRLILSGHNLDGVLLKLTSSSDDITYETVYAWVQSGNGLINVPLSSVSKKYWKILITSPILIPQIAEIFLSATYIWERNPARPAGFDTEFNVENPVSSGGQDRFIIHGEPKQKKVFSIPSAEKTQKDNIIALQAVVASGKPFWLADHEDNWVFCKLAAPLNIKEVSHERYVFEFNILEVLP